MNTNTTTGNDRQQHTNGSDQNRKDEQFWAEWWREFAQTWK
jgi:hypothetical protein